MDLRNKTETFVPGENHEWLGSAHALDTCDPITLDGSAFLSLFADGIVPSGVALGKITATGLYGPYGGNTNEVQTLTVDATSGTYTLTFDGETTAAIAEAATAAAVQSALEALSNINAGDVVVAGSAGGPYTITFTGQYAGVNVPLITATDVDLAGGGDTVGVVQTNAGGSAVSDGRETFVGHLAFTKNLNGTTAGTAGDVGAALLRHGQIIVAKLPTGHGLDNAARNSRAGLGFVYV